MQRILLTNHHLLAQDKRNSTTHKRGDVFELFGWFSGIGREPTGSRYEKKIATCTIQISLELTEPEALADFLRRGSASPDYSLAVGR